MVLIYNPLKTLIQVDNPVEKIAELALDLVDATQQEPSSAIKLTIKLYIVGVVVHYSSFIANGSGEFKYKLDISLGKPQKKYFLQFQQKWRVVLLAIKGYLSQIGLSKVIEM